MAAGVFTYRIRSGLWIRHPLNLSPPSTRLRAWRCLHGKQASQAHPVRRHSTSCLRRSSASGRPPPKTSIKVLEHSRRNRCPALCFPRSPGYGTSCLAVWPMTPSGIWA